MAEPANDGAEDVRESLWGGLRYGMRSLDQYIERCSINSLKELANRLWETVDRIRFMLIIPERFLIHQQIMLRQLSKHLWAALKTETVKPFDSLTDDEKKAYEAALKESVEKDAGDMEWEKLFDEWTRMAIQEKPRVIEIHKMEEAYKSLLYSGLIWAWISFEVFASDLWEAVVNMSAGKVRSRILRSVSAARPTIKVDYIAKYNLDLRGRLGTVMRDGCDFTSLEGIQKAYAVVFPKSQSISDALGKTELMQLEASRHLIVHRSGIVDDEFLRKTNLKLKKGHELPITDKQVLDYCNLTVEVALALLVAAESLVGRKSPKKQTK